MAENPEQFKEEVYKTLRRHVVAVNKLAQNGMYFWDYGNAFLLEASRAGADITKADGEFKYPSYVQDIMGPLFFDYGFGPFRWVCTSGKAEDLETTDKIAADVLAEIAASAPKEITGQMEDNIHWIKEAGEINWWWVRKHVFCMPIAQAVQKLPKRLTMPLPKDEFQHDCVGSRSP